MGLGRGPLGRQGRDEAGSPDDGKTGTGCFSWSTQTLTKQTTRPPPRPAWPSPARAHSGGSSPLGAAGKTGICSSSPRITGHGKEGWVWPREELDDWQSRKGPFGKM